MGAESTEEGEIVPFPTIACEYVRLLCSTVVVFLLVLVAFVGISYQWCVLKLHPAILFFLLGIGIVLLAYVEALHYGCVAIEKWDMTKYEHAYPRAFKCYKLVDTPEKVKKFLVGRQFFVIFVVFLVAQITSFPDIPHNFLGMPPLLVTILVQTGLPGIAITLTFGQLISQIFVEEYTLQFMNLYGCEFVIRLSLCTEWIGVCNFSWLLYYASSFLCFHRRSTDSGERTSSSEGLVMQPVSPTERNRPPDYLPLQAKEGSLNLFDYFKYLWSTCATLGALAIILYGISIEAYVLPTPVVATYIVFGGVLTLLYYLEGLMIAIVATQYWDKESFRDAYPRAYALHEIINRPDNVKRFIIGRQFCTVLTGFLLAQITTFAGWSGKGYDPVGFYIIVKSGLVGVLIVLSFGQLMPQLLAQEYPLRFMNLPGAYSVGVISLVADRIAVGHCAWAIYYATRKFFCRLDAVREGPVVRMNSGDSMALQL